MLGEVAEAPAPLPLFTEPVAARPALARRLAALSDELLDGGDPLRRDELLRQVVRALAAQAGVVPPLARLTTADAARIAARARDVLDAGDPADLAAATGRSRFTIYRAFIAAHGLAPSDYQRQVRLRAARALLGQRRPPAEVAALTGFADQSHLTRWFSRYFGVTPAAYQRAIG
jgi:AraC-like DNA-binding protein